MRNFTIVTVLMLMLVTTQSMAQSTGKIAGSVTDNSNKALSAATISLLRAKDSSLVKAAITDANGKFDIPISKSGSYLLGYSLVGFENNYSEVFVNEGQAITAKTIAL